MSARVSTVIVCDACGRELHTSRTTTTGARGDAERKGWRVSEIGDEPHDDECPREGCPCAYRKPTDPRKDA